jgi:hypothetical protein
MSSTPEKPTKTSLDEKKDIEKFESEHVEIQQKLAPGEHVTMTGETITLTWKTCLVIFVRIHAVILKLDLRLL